MSSTPDDFHKYGVAFYLTGDDGKTYTNIPVADIKYDEPELPYGLTEICIPKAIIKMYRDSPYAGNLPTMTVLYTSGDEQDE